MECTEEIGYYAINTWH